MLYNSELNGSERLEAARLPRAPDLIYEKEWGTMGVIEQKKHFPADYYGSTLGCTETCIDSQISKVMLETKPSVVALENARSQMEFFWGSQISAKGEKHDIVHCGNEHLYRDPLLTPRSKAAALTRQAVNKSTIHLDLASVSLPAIFRDLSRCDNLCSREAAAFLCRASMERIISMFFTSNNELCNKFFDNTFYVGSRETLYPTGISSSCTIREPQHVRHLSELYCHSPLLRSDCGDDVLVPAGCADAHLVAALKAVQHYGGVHWFPDPRSLFVAPIVDGASQEDETERISSFFAKFGFIGVLLHFQGRWEWVIVDDTVPAVRDPDGGMHSAFMRVVSARDMQRLQRLLEEDSLDIPPAGFAAAYRFRLIDQPAELWPIVLEKAIAKVFGSYAAIEGGLCRRAMEWLTGGCGHLHRLSPSSAGFECLEHLCCGGPCVALSLSTADGTPRASPVVVCSTAPAAGCSGPTVTLMSPWGRWEACMRKGFDESCEEMGSLTISYDVFCATFDFVEACTCVSDNDCHYVEASDVSETIDTASSCVVRLSSALGPVRCRNEYFVRVVVPVGLRARVTFTLQQADPRLQLDLPIKLRALPYVTLRLIVWRVTSEDGGVEPLYTPLAQGESVFDRPSAFCDANYELVYKTPHAKVDMACVAELELEGGVYCCTPLVGTPGVPFTLRVTCARAATVKMWRVGDDENAGGVRSFPCVDSTK